MKMKYWYAPQLRPPQFGGMPDGALLERGQDFSGQRFEAWAFPKRLDDEIVRRWDLKLVHTEAE